MLLKILMQEKIMQTSGANTEHKHSEIERFSTSNKQISQKDSVIVNCHRPALISRSNQSSVLEVD